MKIEWYLTGVECVDVSRLTGIPMSVGTRLGRPPDTHPGAIDQGVLSLDEVFIDLSRLSPADAARVMWARIAAHEWLRTDDPELTRGSWSDIDLPRRKRDRSNRIRRLARDISHPGGVK